MGVGAIHMQCIPSRPGKANQSRTRAFTYPASQDPEAVHFMVEPACNRLRQLVARFFD